MSRATCGAGQLDSRVLRDTKASKPVFQRVHTLYASVLSLSITTTTKTMARGGLTLLALALVSQSVEGFSQNDNNAWNARFAELHSDLYTAPLPAALVSQCKNKGKSILNQVTHRIRDLSPAPPLRVRPIRRRLFLFHALFLFDSSSKIFTLFFLPGRVPRSAAATVA